jgi:hydroxypyruvate isomerase
MPRYAANLTLLFNEVGFLERFDAAARAGFSGVEYLFPYEYDKQELLERLHKHHLTQVLHNLPAGNWAGGERGIACHPDRTSEFAAGVEQAIDYATTLECTQVNCLAGIVPPGVSSAEAHATLVGNLRLAAPQCAAAGIRLLIEPINTRDIPGFFLTHTAQALEIIEEVGSDNLFLQYDVYHMQIMEGDLSRTIERALPKIAHIQIADPPARNEPGTGEIGWDFVLKRVDALGYQGWIGCEYRPAGDTVAGLAWRAKYGV